MQNSQQISNCIGNKNSNRENKHGNEAATYRSRIPISTLASLKSAKLRLSNTHYFFTLFKSSINQINQFSFPPNTRNREYREVCLSVQVNSCQKKSPENLIHEFYRVSFLEMQQRREKSCLICVCWGFYCGRQNGITSDSILSLTFLSFSILFSHYSTRISSPSFLYYGYYYNIFNP